MTDPATSADQPAIARNWLRQALTGRDNRTVAIGRLIGFVIALVLLVVLPIWAAGAIESATDDKGRTAQAGVWHELLEALGIYVPLVTAAITGLIRITNPTEPTPQRAADQPQS